MSTGGITTGLCKRSMYCSAPVPAREFFSSVFCAHDTFREKPAFFFFMCGVVGKGYGEGSVGGGGVGGSHSMLYASKVVFPAPGRRLAEGGRCCANVYVCTIHTVRKYSSVFWCAMSLQGHSCAHFSPPSLSARETDHPASLLAKQITALGVVSLCPLFNSPHGRVRAAGDGSKQRQGALLHAFCEGRLPRGGIRAESWTTRCARSGRQSDPLAAPLLSSVPVYLCLS